MAMVLLCLIVAVAAKKGGHVQPIYLVTAMALHVINMTWPRFYHYPAVVWFGLSHILGAVMSRVLLTLVFVLVVTPLAVVRRAMGKDSLKLRQFKAGAGSVMVERDHTFVAADISKPY